MMWYWGPGTAWAMPVFGAVMMIVVWGGLAVLVVVLVRSLLVRPTPHESAVETLRRRLAAGEITAEEYERIRKVIGG